MTAAIVKTAKHNCKHCFTGATIVIGEECETYRPINERVPGEMKLFSEIVYVLFFSMVLGVITEDLQKPIELVTQSTDETARPEKEKQKASDVGTSILVANITGNFEKVNENLNEILRCCKDHCDDVERRANPVNIYDSKMNCKQLQEQLHPLKLPPPLPFPSNHPQMVQNGLPEIPPKVPSIAKKLVGPPAFVHILDYCSQEEDSVIQYLRALTTEAWAQVQFTHRTWPIQARFKISSLPQLAKALRAHRYASVGGRQNNGGLSRVLAFPGSGMDYQSGEHEHIRERRNSDIAELLELGQPIAIEVSENDTATLQELASLGFIDASTATDGGECGTLLNQQPQSERLPLLSGSSEPHIVKIPTALLSVDIDAAASANHVQSLYEQSQSAFESPSNYILPRTEMSLPISPSAWQGQHQMGQPFSARSNLAAFALPLPHQQPNMPITNALLNWPPNQPSQLHHAIGDNLPLVWPQYQPRHFSRPVQPNPPVSWTLGQQGYLTQPSPPEGSSTAGHSQLNLPWSQNQSNQPSLHRQPSSTQEYGKSILSNQQSRPLQRGDSDYQVSAAMK
uniref:Uncharacterized protein n=1 Tax=Ascaris lumbricoides TaxID=6252 RepID=A0A9J2PC11_ASCLU